MISSLRHRSPWGSSAISEGSESIELAPLLEEGAFETIEAGAAALDTTGIGLPLGILAGGLAALGFGAYEIYNYISKSHPGSTPREINRIAQANKHIALQTLNKQHLQGVQIQKKGFVPPPFKYLGPGNSLNRGVPYNKVDAAAQQHDIEYDRARTFQDIQNADHRFIGDALTQVTKGLTGTGTVSDTVGGLVGAAGIGIKYLGEKALGKPVYPNLSRTQNTANSKRARLDQPSTSRDTSNNRPVTQHLSPHDSDFTSTPPRSGHSVQSEADSSQTISSGTFTTAERQGSSDLSVSSSGGIREHATPDSSNELVADVEMGLPGTAQGQGGSGDGNASSEGEIYTIERPISNFGKKISTYRKVHRLMSFGIAHTIIAKNLTTPSVENQRFLTTPLGQIPWDLPCMYLNPSEFNLLSDGSHVKEVRIKIYHRGVRIAFPTASTSSQLATLNQVQNIEVAYGLNKTGYGSDVTYSSFDATQSMKPTDLIPTKDNQSEYTTLFYGRDQSDGSFSIFVPNHQVGYKVPIQSYFCVTAALSQPGGWPCIAENVRIYDGKTTINQCVLEAQWIPNIAPLKLPLRYWRTALPTLVDPNNNKVVQVNGNYIQSANMSMSAATVTSTGMTYSTNQTLGVPQNANLTPFDILTSIEKSQNFKTGSWGQKHNIDIMPSIHVGLQAVPALTTTNFNNINSWTDSQADWDIVCEMDVIEHNPTKLPYATSANVPFGDVMMRGSTTVPNQNGATLGGLYMNTGIRTAT